MFLKILLTLLLIHIVKWTIGYKRKKCVKAHAAYIKMMQTKEKDFAPQERSRTVEELQNIEFDICVVGGGSTGADIALDAATRNLKVCLIEKGDFSQGTSSKSTKLLHGGVRYLEKALRYFNFKQLSLVMDALRERQTLMYISSYLSQTVKIVLPLYDKSKILFYCCMLKLYDFLSFGKSLGRSYFVNKETVERYFGNAKREKLVGGVVYYDGGFDDSRFNVMLVATAEYYGATCLNYSEVLKITRVEDISYVEIKDSIDNILFNVKAKVVVNASGPYTDKLLAKGTSMMVHSAGAHLSLPAKYAPEGMGMVDRRTVDGRVLFIVPFRNQIIAGSTETKGSGPDDTKPTQEDFDFLLAEVQKYNKVKIEKSEVKAIWKGIRPLIKSDAKNSENLVRTYKIIDDNKGLVTVTGGKWTTYRKAAEDALKVILKNYKMCKKVTMCVTKEIKIIGADAYTNDMFYKISEHLNVDVEYAKHLVSFYGGNAYKFKKYNV